MQWKNLKVKQNEFFTLVMHTNIHLLNMREAKILNGLIDVDFLFDVQIELKAFLLRVRSLCFSWKVIIILYLTTNFWDNNNSILRQMNTPKECRKCFVYAKPYEDERLNDSVCTSYYFPFFAKYCKLKEYQIATSGASRRGGSIIGHHNTKDSMKAAIFGSDSMNECHLIWNAVLSVTALRLSTQLGEITVFFLIWINSRDC